VHTEFAYGLRCFSFLEFFVDKDGMKNKVALTANFGVAPETIILHSSVNPKTKANANASSGRFRLMVLWTISAA
jgi:hypothetical protein